MIVIARAPKTGKGPSERIEEGQSEREDRRVSEDGAGSVGGMLKLVLMRGSREEKAALICEVLRIF